MTWIQFEKIIQKVAHKKLEEVNLKYPEESHDLLIDYPLAPEKIEIKESMLSDYCSKITNKYIEVKKPIQNLDNKDKYVLNCKKLAVIFTVRNEADKNSLIFGVSGHVFF